MKAMTEGTPAAIERRIERLVGKFMALKPDTVAEPLRPIAQTVIDQALISNRGGKRLRARLLLGAFQAGTADEGAKTSDRTFETVLDLACAVEIYQTSALIHDDIIDEAATRRGMPSAHVALTQSAGSPSVGSGLALMLGNMLATASVSIASDALARLGRNEGLSVFLDMQRAVEVGQVLDMAGERLELDDPARLRANALDVYAWKTASYTTIAPLELGLLCSGMPLQGAHEAAMGIGLPLGLAFQLADDLLDVDGDPQSTGKPLGGDVIEGKRTVLLADALETGDTNQRQALETIYTQPRRTTADAESVIALFAEIGAITSSHQRIGKLLKKSEDAMEALDLPADAKATLRSICELFVPARIKR